MRYNLETNRGKRQDVNKTQLVMELCAVADLRRRADDGDYDFVILEPEQPVGGCAYVQMACNTGREDMAIETRFVDDAGFRHYHKDTTDLGWLISVFEQFLDGQLPDVTGWEDWTDQM